jgi:hypothetical protein
MDFLRFITTSSTIEDSTCKKVPGYYQSLAHKSLVHAQAPEKKRSPAGSLGLAAGGSA